MLGMLRYEPLLCLGISCGVKLKLQVYFRLFQSTNAGDSFQKKPNKHHTENIAISMMTHVTLKVITIKTT